MSDALPLPPHPNLDQYQKLAEDLQDACKSSDAGAIRQWATRWLSDWPLARDSKAEAKQIEHRWNKLNDTNEHASNCSLAGAQSFIAREHGFTSWPAFTRHIQELARTDSTVFVFESAADAIVNGDLPTLRRLLAENSGLARERSTREHHSTLLHYVSANGIEDFRQKTPPNIVEVTNLLLDAGAEVDAESDAYGGGCTPLGLVATSMHPEKAGVQIAILQTLLDRGAQLRHPSAGGNKHSIVHGCLANGQPAAARFLAGLGAPLDLESAAALGRLDVLRTYFDESGSPLGETDQQQMESALLYASGYGSLEAVEFLLDRGVNPAAHDKQGQTTLHWAAWTPQIGVIKLLLQRGAPVEAKDYRFHSTPLDTALWTWANAQKESNRECCYEAIALLARAGARLDRDQWREPDEEISPVLRKIDSDPRMLAALRGEIPIGRAF